MQIPRRGSRSVTAHIISGASLALLGFLWGTTAIGAEAEKPIQLHPQNPHYFLWRGQPTIIVTSGEHYGMVLNRELDYARYLDALAADGLNYTRIFTGSYVEKQGAFGIQRNTLAPAKGQFLAAWARSEQPGYAGGGNRFDLERWNPEYFGRLKDFVTQAGKRGIVVEVTLFSSIYDNEQWSVNPFNPSNNIQRLAMNDRLLVHTLQNGPLLAYQEKLVRKIVRELNTFDNVIYEIQNEPWADHHTMGDYINPYLIKQHAWPNAVEIPTAAAVAWQSQVAAWIAHEEKQLPYRHLIAQNVANFRLPVRAEDLAPEISIINFHYASPEAATWNYGWNKVLGYDESGFLGSNDASYRREAWNFLLAGGGLFNSLDYSFTRGHEDGADMAANGPGGGSPTLRRQLGVLSRFLRSLPFVSMAPDPTVVKHAPGMITRALSQPGKVYAIYAQGRANAELSLELPKGPYTVELWNTVTGEINKPAPFQHEGGTRKIFCPAETADWGMIVRKAQQD